MKKIIIIIIFLIKKSKISDEQSNKLNNLEKKLDTKIKKEDSDYVKTPEYLSKKRVVINPQTKENKSFMEAITLSLFCKSIGKNNTRANNIRKFRDTINWEDINVPPTSEDYKQFEQNNKDMKLNVLELNDNQIYGIFTKNCDRNFVILHFCLNIFIIVNNITI